MRLYLFAIISSTTAFGASIELKDKSGKICPSEFISQLESKQDSAPDLTLQSDLSSSEAIETSETAVNHRELCTVHITAKPGEGYQIQNSSIAWSSSYSVAKAGRAFWSISESTAASDDQILSHTITGRHLEERGDISLNDDFSSWAAKNIPCGSDVDITLQLAATSRQARGSDPSSIQMKSMLYTVRFEPCTATNR